MLPMESILVRFNCSRVVGGLLDAYFHVSIQSFWKWDFIELQIKRWKKLENETRVQLSRKLWFTSRNGMTEAAFVILISLPK